MSSDPPEHKRSKPWKINLRKRRSGEASRSMGPGLDFGHGASSRSDPFLVVAIDFGTACSGYAYASSLKPDDVHLMRRLDSAPKDGGASHCKVPTALLLTEHEEFVAFGYEAKELYSDMYPEEQQRYLFFEKFKMELHYTENVHRNLLLTSASGRQVSAVTVFAHSLRYFKERFIQEIHDQSTTGVVETAIRWVITVPAIWSPSAKQFVRLAAFEAGLIEEDSQDELLIALEPEAASIYCQKMKQSLSDLNDAMAKATLTSASPLRRNIGTGILRRNKDSSRVKLSSAESSPTSSQSPVSSQSSESPISPRHLEDTALFNTSMTYLVVDCGGGTVDLTVHKLVEDGKLHELYKATGGAWGSVGVDHQFESLLWRIFGKEAILGYQAHCPIGWIQLMEHFESKKHAASPLKPFAVNILLPFSFMQYYFNKTQCTVESTVRAYHDPNIQWTAHGTLRLHSDTLVSLFHPVTDKIVEHIHTLLEHPRLAGISHLFLVGGFAESQVLQHEIRKAFEMRLRVVIPHDVSLSILKGAVFFGIDPTVVKIRRSALTYGVGVLNPFEPKLHPIQKQVTKGGKQWCTDIFEAYVHADQAVSLDDTVVKSYTPAVNSQTSITITLFATDCPEAQFVTDPGVKRMGVLRLQMPDTSWKDKKESYREIKVCMRFGDTEIRVSAVDCKTGEVALATLDLLCK